MATVPGQKAVSSAAASSDRLDSWKEIAAHLKRNVRTVQRWSTPRDFRYIVICIRPGGAYTPMPMSWTPGGSNESATWSRTVTVGRRGPTARFCGGLRAPG